MMYCFINNIHVDYAKLLWEGIYYSFHHSTSSIPYPRFTKIIIGHYMTNFLEISRRARDKYHNLKDDYIMKNIFNLGRYEDKVRMKIPAWMISEAMKHTEHYRMFTEVFGIDIPLNQPQPTESTQGSEEQEVGENVELVNEHLASVEIEKMVEGQENVIDDSSISRNDEHNIPGTRLEPRSDKESTEVEFIDVVIHVNVNVEEEEITDEVYELKQKEKGKIIEEARFMPRKSFATLADHLQEVMVDSLPTMVEKQVKEEVQKQVLSRLEIKFQHKFSYKFRKQLLMTFLLKLIQDNENEQGPSTLGNQVQVDDYDFWTESYALDYDEIPTKQVSQDIIKEVSLTIDEANLKKIANEMLRQRCTSGDEHQYHIDQMKNFLKSDIVWESRKEILVSPHPRKTTPLVQSWPEKIVLPLHKFPAIIFNDDDTEERTFRWMNKKQKEPGKPKEVIYSNSKIIQVFKMYWELGHEHKFITEIVTRRANECIVSITKLDFKNLNKNDIEDMYLLIMNGKVPDYAKIRLLWSLAVFIRSSVIWERVHDFQLGIESYQHKVNLTALTISFLGIKKHEMFSITYEAVHGIIYKNSKKEKKVMRHSEIHKFCDATLNRVLEGLKSYNNDVKYRYIKKDLTKYEVEYLKLFEKEIEVSQADEKMGDVCEWKTTWTTKRTPRIIDP
nr:hypothetical protein [Tanacetum cinerariifolium]